MSRISSYKRFRQKLKCPYIPYMVKKTTLFCFHYLSLIIKKTVNNKAFYSLYKAHHSYEKLYPFKLHNFL